MSVSTSHTSYLVFGINDTNPDVLVACEDERDAKEIVKSLRNGDYVDDDGNYHESLNHNPDNYDSFLYKEVTAHITLP